MDRAVSDGEAWLATRKAVDSDAAPAGDGSPDPR
jgi:hypothetical protein